MAWCAEFQPIFGAVRGFPDWQVQPLLPCLSTVPSDPAKAEETLRSFGATYASVPANLESKVIPGKFNEPMLNFLKNFDKKPYETDKIILQATADALSQRLSEEIPLEEFNKL